MIGQSYHILLKCGVDTTFRRIPPQGAKYVSVLE